MSEGDRIATYTVVSMFVNLYIEFVKLASRDQRGGDGVELESYLSVTHCMFNLFKRRERMPTPPLDVIRVHPGIY